MNKQIDINEYFEIMKGVSGIEVKPEWEDVIKSHLETAKKMATIIEAAPIDENSLELSNTFKPGQHDV